MPRQISRPGLRIDHQPQRVIIESPWQGLCADCADVLPEELFELVGNKRIETDSRPTQMRVTVGEPMSTEAVEELADLIEKNLEWCNGGHQGALDGEF